MGNHFSPHRRLSRKSLDGSTRRPLPQHPGLGSVAPSPTPATSALVGVAIHRTRSHTSPPGEPHRTLGRLVAEVVQIKHHAPCHQTINPKHVPAPMLQPRAKPA